MKHCKCKKTKAAILARLKRIEGQVRGLQNMLETERECIDIIRQISSVSGALRGVWTLIVSEHLKGCVGEALRNKDDGLVDELIEHLKKMK